MSQHWFEVQRHLGRVQVARQSGDKCWLQNHQALVKILAAGLCNTDVRVISGDKEIADNPRQYVIPGHECVGRIVDIRDSETKFKQGDYVVVLPHVHTEIPCSSPTINPTCIGSGHTHHRGWDLDGCFADFIVVPTTSLKRIDQEHLQRAKKQAPELGEAIFAFVEPMLCVISAYALLEEQSKVLLNSDLKLGRALIIGCGPIGVLHGLHLLRRGYQVWFLDTLQKRAELARWCLKDQCHILTQESNVRDFDLVMVTASSADAIKQAEFLVRNRGVVYLFAGLNAIDRATMSPANVFYYERLHRATKGIVTSIPSVRGDKTIFYLGHSGYFESLTTAAITAVAEYADGLNRAVTGIIPHWASSRIASRLPGCTDWETGDGSPAIVSLLHGTDLRNRHCKILICPR
jgi:threonine dehydrogenase-like Zn-dependent dehydrogenase